jgi:serine/threonine-protein kinase
LLLGSYVLIDRIGAGGMGHVFLARHRTFDRRAAVKVVRPDRCENPRVRARFLREVRALGRLNHPHIVHAYDAGTVGRAYYLAMEYVPGPDLGEVLATGAVLAPGRACAYARQAALGLQHLHESGLVHRDVKPGNLRLTDDGRAVKVLDVGLVKDRVAGGDEGLTRAGFLVGTADYVAPEQVADSAAAGPRADQYALGATLFHLLTGELPFPGGTPVARALRRVTADAPPVRTRRPDLSPDLAGVVDRLLARHPEDRFPSAGAAAVALAPFATRSEPAAADTVEIELTGTALPVLPPLPGA